MTTANTTKSNIHDDSIDSTSRPPLAHGPILAALPTKLARAYPLQDPQRKADRRREDPMASHRRHQGWPDQGRRVRRGLHQALRAGRRGGGLRGRLHDAARNAPKLTTSRSPRPDGRNWPNLLDRQEDLNHDSYGGWRWIDGELVKQAGCQWEMQRTSLAYAPHPQSPLSLVDRGISVRLPRSYVFKQFEKDIHREMRSCALVNFAESKAGQAHFRRLGVEVASVTHVTAYGFGSARRTNKALEIYLMRPRQDVSRIAFIAERLVHAHVLARSGARSA